MAALVVAVSNRRKPKRRTIGVIHGLGNDNCVTCSVCEVCRPLVGAIVVDVEGGTVSTRPVCSSCALDADNLLGQVAP